MEFSIHHKSPGATRGAERARVLVAAHLQHGSTEEGRPDLALFSRVLGETIDDLAGDPEATAYLLAALTLLTTVCFHGWVSEHNEDLAEDLQTPWEEHLVRVFEMMVARGHTI